MKKSIDHYKNDVFIVIRKSITDIFKGDVVASALCSYFEHWHNYKLEGIEKEKHENAVAKLHGDEGKLLSLFQFHTVTEIEDAIQIAKKDKIRNSLKTLIDNGIITIHDNPNPKYKFDKTKYYLFHQSKLQSLISAYASAENRTSDFTGVLGYEPNETIENTDVRKIAHDTSKNETLSAENRTSIAKNRHSSAENRTSYTDNTTEDTSIKEKKKKKENFDFDDLENEVTDFLEKNKNFLPPEKNNLYNEFEDDINYFRRFKDDKTEIRYKDITLKFYSEKSLKKWSYEQLEKYSNESFECKMFHRGYKILINTIKGKVYDDEQEQDLKNFTEGTGKYAY